VVTLANSGVDQPTTVTTITVAAGRTKPQPTIALPIAG
jgi:hypothetical protein